MQKKERYAKGDSLCDMHNGFKYLPDNLILIREFGINLDEGASKAVDDLIGRKVTNKILNFL
jgi:hypothetical protein